MRTTTEMYIHNTETMRFLSLGDEYPTGRYNLAGGITPWFTVEIRELNLRIVWFCENKNKE